MTRRNGGLPPPEGLRVVILSDAVSSRNGVGTYYDDLAHHLESRVGQVTLLAPPANGDGNFRGWTTVMPGDPTQRLYWPSPIWLGRIVQELDPHVIVAATPGGFGMLGLAMAATLRTAFCVGYHTEYSELAGLYWKDSFGKVYHALLALWDRLMFRFGSVVLVTNESLLRQALSLGAKEAHIMGTPIQADFLETPIEPHPREIRTVTFTGRLAPEKELGQILEASEAFPELHFRIAGDGILRPEVEARAARQENLEYVGWITRDKVLDLLDQTDLLVLPSRFETFGTVAFEAMVRGRLALVSPNCGIARWPELAPGLVVMEEGETLVEALRRLRALPPEERVAVAQRGHRASQAMSWRTVDDWVQTLQRAVAGKTFS
jgi:glycosyltransferase involved in cell wall biosynthesis